MNQRSTEPRVIALNLDAFDMSLAQQLMDQGKLKGLKSILEKSAKFSLEHGFERRGRDTGLTGEHIATGLGPETTDRWGPFYFHKEDYSIVQKFSQEVPFLAHLPQKVVVFDATYFVLEDCKDAVGVVGWSGHDPGAPSCSQPASLRQEMDDKFGPPVLSEMDLHKQVYNERETAQKYGLDLAGIVRKRFQIINWLLQERFPNWEMAMLSVEESHDAIEQLAHGLLPGHPLEAEDSAKGAAVGLEAVYEAISEGVAELVDRYPEVRFAIYTMHGMNINKTDVPSMVLLPELMCRSENGFSLFSSREDWVDKEFAVVRPGEDWWFAVNSSMHYPALTQCVQLGERVLDKAERGVRKAYRLSTGRELPRKTLPRDEVQTEWTPAAQYRRYWPGMRAFALPSLHDGCVRINLKGREKNGLVDVQDYRKTVDEIVSMVTATKDARTGEPVVDKVFFANLENPMALNESQADIRFAWSRQFTLAFQHPEHGKIGPAPIRRAGGHTGEDGALMLLNVGLPAGDFGRRSSYDVPPTVVDLMESTRLNYMQGHSVVRKDGNDFVIAEGGGYSNENTVDCFEVS